jgi:hypothetical protein
MAGLTAAGRNAAVDGLAAVTTHVGLLDASGTELTGGTPAYARKAVTWTAAAAGIRDNNAQLLFDVPAVTVCFHGLYSAITAGTNFAILPVQGATSSLPQACTYLASTDTFTSYAHGLANADRVILLAVDSSGTMPAALNSTTVYFVVGSATNTFQVSTTSGGAAVDAATDTELFVVKVVPEVFAAQGQYSIATGALDLDANLI